MPALVRKLAVFAAGEGLVLKPLLHHRPQPQRSLRIEYATHAVSSIADFEGKDIASFECHGIVGTRSESAKPRHLLTSSRLPNRRYPLLFDSHYKTPAGRSDTGPSDLCNLRRLTYPLIKSK